MTESREEFHLDASSVYADVAAIIGPVFTEAAVMNLLSKTADELAAMRADRQILSGVTSDGHRVYPAAQFDGRGIIEGTVSTLTAVGEERIDDWALLLWFAAPDHDYLEGLSPLDWLAGGRDPRRLDALTNATAARWAG